MNEESNEELDQEAQEVEVEVETPKTEEKPNGVSDYKGTEGSKWGKIVVAMENAVGLTIIDEGPEDKGFKTAAQAIEAVKKHVTDGLDNGLLEVDRLPAFHVLRMVKIIEPRPVQTTVLDFGDD